ncbi:MAG TPA: VOC family protein [Streptosporangiaceae bacterium]|nr:VOC family protein [Streptosporangiaceae bacterium]
MKLEAVQIPVSDVDLSRDFYTEKLGFNLDIDQVVPGGRRIVQLTPPGSGCSIQLVQGGGPLPGLTLVVSDVVATHAELTKLGAPLSDVIHFEDGKEVPGHSDEPWSTMTFFADPDGNKWIVQERPAE